MALLTGCFPRLRLQGGAHEEARYETGLPGPVFPGCDTSFLCTAASWAHLTLLWDLVG